MRAHVLSGQGRDPNLFRDTDSTAGRFASGTRYTRRKELGPNFRLLVAGHEWNALQRPDTGHGCHQDHFEVWICTLDHYSFGDQCVCWSHGEVIVIRKHTIPNLAQLRRGGADLIPKRANNMMQ